MVRAMADEVPPSYMDGVAAIEVSARTVHHPVRSGVYTLGECVPVHGEGYEAVSRVVLYFGSFKALAGEGADFDWHNEAWETLTHELRHHLEWRADSERLEQYDWAAEQNFARREGRRFDPLFYLSGEKIDEDVYRVDDDLFFERVVASRPAAVRFDWHGRGRRVTVPDAPLPLYLVIQGLTPIPEGDVVVVLRRKPRLLDVLRGARYPREYRVPTEDADSEMPPYASRDDN